MTIEVELKFPLDADNPTAEEIITRLEQLGSHAHPRRQQRDCYYAHPVRDFATTDEALRIRVSDSITRLTYKGPLLDPVAKTRRELEFEIASSEQAASLLEALGFRPVREVAKQRRPFVLVHDGHEIEVVIDEVESLGTFVELETLIDEGDGETGRTAARNCLLALAAELGLSRSERRSYLGLLLDLSGN